MRWESRDCGDRLGFVRITERTPSERNLGNYGENVVFQRLRGKLPNELVLGSFLKIRFGGGIGFVFENGRSRRPSFQHGKVEGRPTGLGGYYHCA